MEQENTNTESDPIVPGLAEAMGGSEGSEEVVETTQNESAERGTQETTENNGEEAAKEQPASVSTPNSQSDKPKEQTKPSVQEVKKPSSYEKRKAELSGTIQDYIRQRDALKKEVEELNKAKATQQEPPKPLEIVERPKAPVIPVDPQTGKEFSRQEIQRAVENLQDKADAGQATIEDMRNIRHLNGLLQSMDLHQLRLEQWEIKNGQEVKQYEGAKAHFTKMAADKWPELKNSDSQTFKVFTNLDKTIDKWMKGPERAYYVAEIANMLVGKKNHDSELGVLKKELETLKKENQTLKGKFAPAKQVEAASAGEAKEEWNLLDQLKQVAPNGFV